MRKLLLAVFFSVLLASCGSDKGGDGSNGTNGGGNSKSGGENFQADSLKIHSYRLVHKMSSFHNEKKLFHQLEVDRGSAATYNIRYEGSSILDPKVVYNQIRCSAQATCEVWSRLVNGTYKKNEEDSMISVSEDSSDNRRKIEVKDPDFRDYTNDGKIYIQAVTADGKTSAEVSSTINRQ